MRPIRQIAEERQKINSAIRAFFDSRDFVEVETPICVQSPGMEPNLSPFETEVISPSGEKFPSGLITSPEYSMKKLLGYGLEKIYTITKVFRNEEDLGGLHNPEFSMLEWYRQGEDYQACMDETEELVLAVSQSLSPLLSQDKGGMKGGLSNFRRVRVRDLFLEHVDIDLDSATAQDLRTACTTHGIHTHQTDTESDLFYRLFLEKVEPFLGPEPVFVYDYPKHQAALSQLNKDGLYGQRFELYINGLEICNGFTELLDPAEQRSRFEEEIEERIKLGKTIFPIDEELLRLLPSIRQPTYGNALGIDRLHMFASGAESIEDVLLFPASGLFKKEL